MPKPNKEQIDEVKDSLYYKIFDILNIDNKKYYLDREFNLIWNSDKEIVGLIDNNKNIFFDEIDKIITDIKK